MDWVELGNKLFANPPLLIVAGEALNPDFPKYREDSSPQFSREAFRHTPDEAWQKAHQLRKKALSSSLNAAHQAVAELQSLDPESWVVSLDPGDLWQKAGCRQVFSLFGSLNQIVCESCGHRDVFPPTEQAGTVFCPACNGVARPDVLLNDASFSSESLAKFEYLGLRARTILIAGTDPEKQPIKRLLEIVAEEGDCTLVELSEKPSELSFISEKIAYNPIEGLSQLLKLPED